MRQLQFAKADERTLGDIKSEGGERLMTLCDQCGNTSSLSLDQLVAKYRVETRVVHVLAILQTRCKGVSGGCAIIRD
jgi:hypothetical protein